MDTPGGSGARLVHSEFSSTGSLSYHRSGSRSSRTRSVRIWAGLAARRPRFVCRHSPVHRRAWSAVETGLDGFPGERRSPHVASFASVEPSGAMHGRSIVPHHQIAGSPAMAINELRLSRVFRQVAEKHSRLRDRPADECARVRGQEQRLAAGPPIDANEGVANGAEVIAFLTRHVGEADRLAGVNERVFAHQTFDLGFRALVERIIGCPHIREFGLAAPGRDHPRRQQGVFGGNGPKRTVRVPETIGKLEQPNPVLGRHESAVAR